MPPEARQRLQRRPPAGPPSVGGGAPPAGTPQRRPQAPPPALPSSTGPGMAPGREEQERVIKEAAMAKVSESQNIPLEALEDFSIQELELLPKVLQKVNQLGLNSQALEKTVAMTAGKSMRGKVGPSVQSGRERSAQQTKDDLGKEISLKSPKRKY